MAYTLDNNQNKQKKKKKKGNCINLIAGLLVEPEGIKLKPQLVLSKSR